MFVFNRATTIATLLLVGLATASPARAGLERNDPGNQSVAVVANEVMAATCGSLENLHDATDCMGDWVKIIQIASSVEMGVNAVALANSIHRADAAEIAARVKELADGLDKVLKQKVAYYGDRPQKKE